MSVKQSLELFIERVCVGGKAQTVEIAILPKILEFYFKGEQEKEPEKLLSASEVAELLGFTKETHCKPQAAVERLAREGKLHEPVRHGAKTLRWKQQWVDDYLKEVGLAC